MLVSAIQHCEWVISVHTYPPSPASLPRCPFPILPLWVTTEHELSSALHGSLLIAVCFTYWGVYMAPLFPIHPTLLFACLFSTSAYLFLLYKSVHLYHFSRFHALLYFSSWLKSLCMIDSKSVPLEMTQLNIFYAEQCYSSHPTLSLCSHVFSVCFSIPVQISSFVLFFWIPYMYATIWCLFFWFIAVWHSSPCRFTTDGPSSFCYMVQWYPFVYMCQVFFIQRLLPSPGCCK